MTPALSIILAIAAVAVALFVAMKVANRAAAMADLRRTVAACERAARDRLADLDHPGNYADDGDEADAPDAPDDLAALFAQAVLETIQAARGEWSRTQSSEPLVAGLRDLAELARAQRDADPDLADDLIDIIGFRVEAEERAPAGNHPL